MAAAPSRRQGELTQAEASALFRAQIESVERGLVAGGLCRPIDLDGLLTPIEDDKGSSTRPQIRAHRSSAIKKSVRRSILDYEKTRTQPQGDNDDSSQSDNEPPKQKVESLYFPALPVEPTADYPIPKPTPDSMYFDRASDTDSDEDAEDLKVWKEKNLDIVYPPEFMTLLERYETNRLSIEAAKIAREKAEQEAAQQEQADE